jgi:microcystin-dependent protein
MADPQTPTIGIYQPTRGSYVGTWDVPVNVNSEAIDSLFGNVAVVGLSSSPVVLTTPPNTASAWAGPYQSQSSLIRCTGALTTNIGLQFPRAGYYIIENLCTDQLGRGAGSVTNSFSIVASTGASGGKTIGLPPGKKCHIFSDGTDMDWVDMPDTGTSYDLHGATGLPTWMTIGTQKQPYLIKDGSVYNNSVYPVLAGMLGTIFGGSSGLTFGVPDERARARIAYDPNSTGRLTGPISGTVMGSVGGDQNLQTHTHINTLTDPGHSHPLVDGGSILSSIAGNTRAINSADSPNNNTSIANNTTGISINNVSAGSGSGQNVQPSIVSFLPLIKT